MGDGRGRAARVVVLLAAAVLLTGCTSGSPAPADPAVAPPAASAAPPAPPAACLLDGPALAAATGLTWTPDETTASDTRCVYDPAGAPGTVAQAGTEFVAVDIAPVTAADAAVELDTVAAVCEPGSRAPVVGGAGGFVCRFRGGSVFAAAVRAGRLVTVGSSAVPAGTTAAQLVLALGEQLGKLG